MGVQGPSILDKGDRPRPVASVAGSPDRKEAMQRQAVLIAVFGTSYPDAAQAFERFGTHVRERNPEAELRWAYTSTVVRRKLAARGHHTESVEEALEHLAADGFRSIAVQSLHTIPGAEYHKVRGDITRFRHRETARDTHIAVGKPLLCGYADTVRVAKAMLAGAPAQRQPDDALVFMGHGSEKHAADLFYIALASVLGRLDPRALLGTVEGHPTLDDVLEACRSGGCRRAWLLPLMAIAGDHALNDMAGEGDDSWQSTLTRAGIACTPVLSGTLDNPGIRNVWLDHLTAALMSLRAPFGESGHIPLF